MSTYREAICHARAGGTATLGGKIVRLLTQEEADAHALVHNPSRRQVFIDDPEHPDHGKPLVKKNKLVFESFGQGQPRQLGLYDVSQNPPVEFRPTDDDIASDWVRQGVDDAAPEVIPPETVDEALVEHEAPIE